MMGVFSTAFILSPWRMGSRTASAVWLLDVGRMVPLPELGGGACRDPSADPVLLEVAITITISRAHVAPATIEYIAGVIKAVNSLNSFLAPPRLSLSIFLATSKSLVCHSALAAVRKARTHLSGVAVPIGFWHCRRTVGDRQVALIFLVQWYWYWRRSGISFGMNAGMTFPCGAGGAASLC